jgi:hypothetical protein
LISPEAGGEPEVFLDTGRDGDDVAPTFTRQRSVGQWRRGSHPTRSGFDNVKAEHLNALTSPICHHLFATWNIFSNRQSKQTQSFE